MCRAVNVCLSVRAMAVYVCLTSVLGCVCVCVCMCVCVVCVWWGSTGGLVVGTPVYNTSGCEI